MTFTPTPGPWINSDGLVNGQETRPRFAPGTSTDIFDAAEWPKDLRSEALDNAKLIAAAHDMLVALQKIAKGLINTDFVMASPPDWHSAFAQFQEIAQTCIKTHELE